MNTIMRQVSLLLLSLSSLGVPAAAPAAADCNFDKPVGRCTGSVEVLSSGGSEPSFTAEIKITSSAPSCSKVEYYLDSTPQTTILRGGNSGQESLFGTTPILRTSIEVQNCTVYEDAAVGTKDTNDAKNSLKGTTWQFPLTDLETIKSQTVLHIEEDHAGVFKGYAVDTIREQRVPRGPYVKRVEKRQFSGTRDGNELMFSWASHPDAPFKVTINGRTMTSEMGPFATRR
ncbi:hypothetical protein [Rhizobium sp. BK176]|uniref:hypothetical protein n=1 Tax=Rhizobium sp. BK176 TaxID=2587071 RepID=UPI00216A5657|nr:hypothetical protein [Rhizobium sp. BK176]MCS4089223.1 hypothetical protein [Rhizobium sp. BK176]